MHALQNTLKQGQKSAVIKNLHNKTKQKKFTYQFNFLEPFSIQRFRQRAINKGKTLILQMKHIQDNCLIYRDLSEQSSLKS